MPVVKGGLSDDEADEDYTHLLGLGQLDQALEDCKNETLPCLARRSNVAEIYDAHAIERVFEKNKQKFIKCVLPQFYYDSLLSNDIFTSQELILWKSKLHNEDLNNPESREECYKRLNTEIYTMLEKKLYYQPHLFKNFVTSLQEENWYEDLGNLYQKDIVLRPEDEIDDFSKDVSFFKSPESRSVSRESETRILSTVKPQDRFFDIPAEFPIYVERENKVNELLEILNRFDKSNDGWLILHGMGGSGKTTLASNTIRKLKENQYTQGIFWIKIDNIQPTQYKQKLDLLADFVSTFYPREEATRFKQEQIEGVRFQINKHFQTYKQSLIILDDVWNEDVIKLYEFGVPVLVTTRDEGIISPSKFSNIYKIQVKTNSAKDKDVWTIEEAIKLFNKCFEQHRLQEINSRFPIVQNQQVHEILKNFNYLPYCIPLIFQYMEPVYQELQHFLIRGSDTEENISRELDKYWNNLCSSVSSCERFQDKWIELSNKSIANLSPKLKDRFLDFAIFCESVPSEVFFTLWCEKDRLNELDVKNILSELKRKSLIIQTYSSDKTKRISYTVHNLTHEFLLYATREQLQTTQKRHASLVERYLEKICRNDKNGDYDYSLLPKDGYIFLNLAYHIHEARMFEYFDKIFLDLGFVIEKIKATGPSDLLNEYQLYQNNFGSVNKLQDFRNFVASNSSNLLQENFDLLQLALFQPEDSCVYAEARRIIESKKLQRVYFDWKNQSTCGLEQTKKLISFSCNNGIDCSAISPDSRIIVTVKGQVLQLWNVSSGELLETNGKHLADIKDCKFSKDNSLLLTCSVDGTARLWLNRFCSSMEHTGNMPCLFDDTQAIRTIHQERRRRSSGGNTSNADCHQLIAKNQNKAASHFLTLFKIFEESKLKKDARTIKEAQFSVEYRCGDISHNNSLLIIGDSVGCLNLWCVDSSFKLGKIQVQSTFDNEHDNNESYEIECCSFNSDSTLALALQRSDVFIYRVHPGNKDVFELVRVLHHNYKCYNAVFFNEFEEDLVLSSSGIYLFEWDLKLHESTSGDESFKIGPSKQYSITANSCKNHCHQFTYSTISSDGQRIAAFETTRNEIYLWNRSREFGHDPFNSSFDSSMSVDDLKTVPCYSFYRCSSDLNMAVLILNFCLEKNDALFSASNSGEIVLWDIKKNDRRTSLVDLRKFAYSGMNEDLRILSIDNIGYLRLYRTMSAKEDRQFLTDLKNHLKNFKRSESEFSEILPKNKITCCDIESTHIIFGTDSGEVFYFNIETNVFLHDKLNEPGDSQAVIDCVFLNVDAGDISFFAFSENNLCLLSVNSEDASSKTLTRHVLTLDDIRKLENVREFSNKDFFDVIRKHPRQPWVIMSMNSGHVLIVDYQNAQLKVIKIYEMGNERISYITFGLGVDGTIELIILSTCNKNIFIRVVDLNPYGSEIQEDLFKRRNILITAACIPRSLCYNSVKGILYVGHDNGTISSYTLLTRTRTPNVFNAAHKNWVMDQVLSPEHDILVTGADSICIWKASTGELLQNIITQGKVYKLYVGFDGKKIHGSLDGRHFPRITIATVTDASCLYTFQTLN